MGRLIHIVLATSLLGGLPAPQKKRDAVRPAVEDWKPEIVPADALKYSAELDEQASAEVKKWVGGYAKKEMRERAVDPKATMAAADDRFPQASDEARDAVTFLLFYAAYKDEDQNQRTLSYRIRDIDRDTIEITRQIQQIWKNDQSRGASPTQGIGAQQRIAIEEQVQKMESQLRELADERQLKSTLMNASRRKVNQYLKVLAAVHPRMKGVDAAILRLVK